ncbi:MAG: type III pantothenate kinase [Planctomycetota bacterium]
MSQKHLLAVSVGNTRTRLGTFADGKLTETATLDNADMDRIDDAVQRTLAPVAADTHGAIVASSVNPGVADHVFAEIAKRTKHAIHRVERDLPIPVGRQLDPEAIVGEDRLLNAAAAYDVLKQACVVVDAGTAITVDFVDGAGTFHGGAIAPGGQLMLDALHQRTDALPEVELEKPEDLVGHNTIQAMRAGVYYGLRGMVYELTERYAEAAGLFPLVVATGGDAALLFKDDARIDRVVPDLTLMGLRLTWDAAKKRLDEGDASAQEDPPNPDDTSEGSV